MSAWSKKMGSVGKEMAKYPRLIPAYAFAPAGINPNAFTDPLLRRLDAMGNGRGEKMFAAPPHLRSTYCKAIVAGYELGEQLNLPKERLAGTLSLDHLVRIGSAFTSYAIERNPRIPRMTSIASLRRALVPLMGVKPADFVNPYTNQPYGLNASLSGKNYADLSVHAPHTVFAYEATAAPDGTRGVLFGSGAAVRVPEREWERLRKAPGIE